MVAIKDFNARSDESIRYAIRRSNIVINCIGAERETWNYSFDEVHVDIARRIAEAAAASPACERLMHLSCLSASPDAPSKRLRTKVRAGGPWQCGRRAWRRDRCLHFDASAGEAEDRPGKTLSACWCLGMRMRSGYARSCVALDLLAALLKGRCRLHASAASLSVFRAGHD